MIWDELFADHIAGGVLRQNRPILWFGLRPLYCKYMPKLYLSMEGIGPKMGFVLKKGFSHDIGLFSEGLAA